MMVDALTDTPKQQPHRVFSATVHPAKRSEQSAKASGSLHMPRLLICLVSALVDFPTSKHTAPKGDIARAQLDQPSA